MTRLRLLAACSQKQKLNQSSAAIHVEEPSLEKITDAPSSNSANWNAAHSDTSSVADTMLSGDPEIDLHPDLYDFPSQSPMNKVLLNFETEQNHSSSNSYKQYLSMQNENLLFDGNLKAAFDKDHLGNNELNDILNSIKQSCSKSPNKQCCSNNDTSNNENNAAEQPSSVNTNNSSDAADTFSGSSGSGECTTIEHNNSMNCSSSSVSTNINNSFSSDIGGQKLTSSVETVQLGIQNDDHTFNERYFSGEHFYAAHDSSDHDIILDSNAADSMNNINSDLVSHAALNMNQNEQRVLSECFNSNSSLEIVEGLTPNQSEDSSLESTSAHSIISYNGRCQSSDYESDKMLLNKSATNAKVYQNAATISYKEFLSTINIETLQSRTPIIFLNAFSILSSLKSDTDSCIQKTIVEQISTLEENRSTAKRNSCLNDIPLLTDSTTTLFLEGFGQFNLSLSKDLAFKVFKPPFNISQLLEIELIKNKLNFKFVLPQSVFLFQENICFSYATNDITMTLEKYQQHFLHKINFDKRLQINQICKSILNGLHFLQSNQIIHSCLCSSNIFIKNNSALIGNFQFAKYAEGPNVTSKSTTYFPRLSPEQLNNDVAVKESDIWSFGILYMELVTFLFGAPYPSLKQGSSVTQKIEFVKSSNGFKTFSFLNKTYEFTPDDMEIWPCLKINPKERCNITYLVQLFETRQTKLLFV